jgi:hypothetical protein
MSYRDAIEDMLPVEFPGFSGDAVGAVCLELVRTQPAKMIVAARPIVEGVSKCRESKAQPVHASRSAERIAVFVVDDVNDFLHCSIIDAVIADGLFNASFEAIHATDVIVICEVPLDERRHCR